LMGGKRMEIEERMIIKEGCGGENTKVEGIGWHEK